MVRSIGFEMKTGECRYCVIEGEGPSLSYVMHGVRYTKNEVVSDLMDKLRNTFSEILSEFRPDVVGYRVAISSPPSIKKVEQYPHLYFSYGILNLVAHDMQVPVKMFHNNSFTAKFFGVKGDKFDVCDQLIGVHPPNWDQQTRWAALAAIGALK